MRTEQPRRIYIVFLIKQSRLTGKIDKIKRLTKTQTAKLLTVNYVNI